MSPHFL
jgi:hypothetical protein